MATATKRNWNWFKDEHTHSHKVPVRHHAMSNMPGYAVPYLRPLTHLFSEMNQMLENRLRHFDVPLLSGVGFWEGQNMFRPHVNIASNNEEYTITVETPGIEEKDINIDISQDGLLTISGEKRQESEDIGKDYEFVESTYGAFQRTLSLPEDVDQEAIEARFRNGILTITCLRSAAVTSRTRQVPISGSKAGQERSRSGHEGVTGQESSRVANANVTPKKAA